MEYPIILFDGVCNLCNGSVLFIIKRDPKAQFRFASLQSAYGENFLKEKNLSTKEYDSIVLIEGDRFYTQSSAALRIAKRLNGAWPLFYIGIIIPKFLRDAVYNFIAKNRYRWFGKKDACMIPTPELRSRFME
ncbi:thiol-disulfide oxidoreductase DCC family protein [bacterium]|nr:thiol-disulfide oxidoreductase DCC family protein [bacterium]